MSTKLDLEFRICMSSYQRNFAKENLQANEFDQFFMKAAGAIIPQLSSSAHLK